MELHGTKLLPADMTKTTSNIHAVVSIDLTDTANYSTITTHLTDTAPDRSVTVDKTDRAHDQTATVHLTGTVPDRTVAVDLTDTSHDLTDTPDGQTVTVHLNLLILPMTKLLPLTLLILPLTELLLLT